MQPNVKDKALRKQQVKNFMIVQAKISLQITKRILSWITLKLETSNHTKT